MCIFAKTNLYYSSIEMRLSKYFPPSVLLLLLFLSISSLNAIGQTSPLVDRDTFYIFGIQEQEFKKQFLRKPLPLEPNHGTIWVRTDQKLKLDTNSFYRLLYTFYGSGVWEISFPNGIPIDVKRLAENYEVIESHSDEKYTKLIGNYHYKRVKIRDNEASQYSKPMKANVDVSIYMRKWVVEYLTLPFYPKEQKLTTDLPYNKKKYPLAYGYYLWRIIDILPVQ